MSLDICLGFWLEIFLFGVLSVLFINVKEYLCYVVFLRLEKEFFGGVRFKRMERMRERSILGIGW